MLKLTERIRRYYGEFWRLRIVLPIMFVHLFAIPLLVYQFLLHFEKPVWDAHKIAGESLLRDVQNEIAIQQLASHRAPGQLQKTIDEMAERYQFISLAVFDNSKRLRAFRGRPNHTPFAGNRTMISLVPDNEELFVTRWVENQEACHACHPSGKMYIGAIEAKISLAGVAAGMNHQRKKAMLVTFLILSGVFSLIYVSHHYFITAPVEKVMDAMKRVREGDLCIHIPIKRRDELSTMAENFNQVVSSLRSAKQELEKRHQSDMYRAEQLASVGEIAAGLAHEVKNPLAGIKSALDVVVSEMNDDSPHKEILNQIIEESNRIAAIINNLLDYARPRPARPEWCDVQMIVSDLTHIFSPQCQKQRASFQVDSPAQPGSIYVDSQELRQVLINILRNALEAVDGAGAIRMDVGADEMSVRFSITDNGTGMDSATKEKIFQPFFTTKAAGTGLGLAIVSRLVKDMGGALHIDSTVGNGTRVDVILPREARVETADCG